MVSGGSSSSYSSIHPSSRVMFSSANSTRLTFQSAVDEDWSGVATALPTSSKRDWISRSRVSISPSGSAASVANVRAIPTHTPSSSTSPRASNTSSSLSRRSMLKRQDDPRSPVLVYSLNLPDEASASVVDGGGSADAAASFLGVSALMMSPARASLCVSSSEASRSELVYITCRVSGQNHSAGSTFQQLIAVKRTEMPIQVLLKTHFIVDVEHRAIRKSRKALAPPTTRYSTPRRLARRQRRCLP